MSLSTFTNCKLYSPLFFSFGTVTPIVPFVKLTSSPSLLDSEVVVVYVILLTYKPFSPIDFVTVIVMLPINDLYPAGAVFSFITMVSVPISEIDILEIEITPLLSVVYSCSCPLFIFTPNIAPESFVFLFALSTFTICML